MRLIVCSTERVQKLQELTVITITAGSIGLLHTLLGPDHYLPFIVMARARKWSLFRTGFITALCGAGHVMGSVILGTIGIALGISINKLGAIESFRGGIAAWLLIVFGAGYLIWGLFRARKGKPHIHWHAHGDTNMPIHRHTHSKDNLHVHKGEKAANLTPWILFTIFVFGPCEALIPLLMYPAAKSNIFGLALAVGVFGIVTIMTMLGIVIFLSFGVNLLPMGRLERYTHAMAGATVCICGIAIRSWG